MYFTFPFLGRVAQQSSIAQVVARSARHLIQDLTYPDWNGNNGITN
jgi:hypothetical protein